MNFEEIDLENVENRYFNLLSNISDVVIESDLKGKFLYISPQCEKMFGHKPEYYVGQRAFKFIHPDDLQKITDGMQQAFYGETVEIEYRVKKRGDSYVYVSARGCIIDNEGQKRYLAVIRDITETKSMEEELNSSKNKLIVLNKINSAFLTIFDNEVYGAILSIILETFHSKDGVFGYINEKGDFICPSMTRDIWNECQMGNKANIFPRSSWGGIWGMAMLDGKTKYSNEPFKVPEGHIQIFNALDVPIIYHGNLIGNILVGNKEKGYNENDIQLLESISNNISPILYNRLQKEKKESELKESEEKLRGILASIKDQVVILDRNLTIIYHNEVVKEIYGPSALGGKCYQVYHGFNEPCSDCQVKRTFEDGEVHHKECLREIRGKTGYCSCISSVYETDKEGRPISVIEVSRDITERKIANETIKESALMLQKSQEIGHVGSFEMDLETNEVVWSDQLYKLFGLKNEGRIIDYEKVLTLIHPDDRDRAIRVSNEAAKELKPYTLEHRVIHPDGKILNLLIRGDVIRNEKNEVVKIGGTTQDITERKKNEQKLRESEEKYRLIFENSPASISIADLNGYVYTMNKKMSEITGYTIEELNKTGFHNIFVNPNDPKKTVEILNIEGKVRNHLSKLKDKKGKEFDALFNIDVINFEGEKLLLTNMEDTRELEDLKTSLYEKDLLARIFMENISGFVVLLRPNTRKIIAMNKYAKDMGGIPGLTCFNTIGQSKTPCPWCLAPKLWESGEAQHLVVDALDVAWDTYWIPIRDDLYLHYGFDITEQAKREKNLKELNQIKSQLLRRASHELKTPLVSIKGFTDLLLKLKSGEFESKSTPIVQEIKGGCLRLETLVNDIIFASKLEDSQINLSKSLENLPELVTSAVNALKGIAYSRKQKILFDLPEEMFTMVDKDRIQEVITNLISNAVKYTPKNGTIKLKSKISEGYFTIMIEDNGIGFTVEEQKDIFTQFGKIERYGQGFDVVSEGSGLGLYIAKKILTQHNGSIWLESEGRNKGTTFFFSLPIIKNTNNR